MTTLITGIPPRHETTWRRLLNPVTMCRRLWESREIISQFAWRDVQARFHDTALGFLWPVLEQLSRLAVYTVVFIALGIRFKDMGEGSGRSTALNIFCGLVIFGIFADVVTRAPSAVLARGNLVKKVVFPVETLPVALLGSALVVGAIGIVVTILGAGVVLRTISPTLPLLPVALLPLVLLSLGLAWMLAGLGVFLRDLRQAVGVVVGNLLFFLTPVIYPLEMIETPWVRAILLANPLTTFVGDARRTILAGEQPQWSMWALWLVVGIASTLIGYACFMKARRGFGDVL
ncbi:MAG: ABC transporter permease [Phycisphaerales bacterium]